MFWVLELISTGIQSEYNRNEHCILLLVLDIPNLLTVNLYLLNAALCTHVVQGLLIFLVTVAKKPVFLGLKEKATTLVSQASGVYPRDTGMSDVSMSEGTEMRSLPPK